MGSARGVETAHIVNCERDEVAKTFGIAEALAAEIMDVNDNSGDFYGRWAPSNDRGAERERADREKRWRDVRAWVEQHIAKATGNAS